MLEAKALEKKYRNKTAVKDISLHLEKGKIYALLGPNGSGKTTFMKMAAGLIKPTAGLIRFENAPIGVESKKHVAYMSTEPFFYNYMTVKEVGNYYADFWEDFSRERYQQLLNRMGLREQDKAKTLSSGMAAKLKIAATMARKASLYLLDEPLNGIDLLAREQIINTIIEMAEEEVTIVISSHLVEELEQLVDSVIFIKDGEVVLTGEAEELRTRRGKSIVELYREVYAK